MKNKANYRNRKITLFFAALVMAVFAAGLYWYSASQNTLPEGIPENVYNFLISYLEMREKDPDNTVDYCHFEYDMEKQAYIDSYLEIQGYNVLNAESLSDGFYVFNVHLKRDSDLSTNVYLFVGPVNGQLVLMNNVYNVPEEIRSQMNEDDLYEYTFEGDLIPPSSF